MEISGKIIKTLDVRSGVSKTSGKGWTSQQYVLETAEANPKRVCFEVFGEDKIKSMNIQTGEDLIVSFDIDAREYQGRWYNQIRAWKVERKVATDSNVSFNVPVGPQMGTTEKPVSSPLDDLPFEDNFPF